MTVHDFSNKNLKKLYPDLKFVPYFIRNTPDLKLKMLFLIGGALLYQGYCIENCLLPFEMCSGGFNNLPILNLSFIPVSSFFPVDMEDFCRKLLSNLQSD